MAKRNASNLGNNCRDRWQLAVMLRFMIFEFILNDVVSSFSPSPGGLSPESILCVGFATLELESFTSHHNSFLYIGAMVVFIVWEILFASL